MSRVTPRPPSHLPRYSGILIALSAFFALAASLAIAMLIQPKPPQWKLAVFIVAILLGAGCTARLGFLAARRRWPTSYGVVACAFIGLTCVMTSCALFSDALLPADADPTLARSFSLIPALVMALTYEVAKRLSQR